MIGDVLTISISENTSAAKAAASSGSKAVARIFLVLTLFEILVQSTAKASDFYFCIQ